MGILDLAHADHQVHTQVSVAKEPLLRIRSSENPCKAPVSRRRGGLELGLTYCGVGARAANSALGTASARQHWDFDAQARPTKGGEEGT